MERDTSGRFRYVNNKVIFKPITKSSEDAIKCLLELNLIEFVTTYTDYKCNINLTVQYRVKRKKYLKDWNPL